MTRKPRSRLTTKTKLIDAAMNLAAADGWHALSMDRAMDRIAAEAGITLEDARGVFASSHALLEHFVDQIDRNALAECDQFQDEDTVRDRLFALLMARLDALTPYKPAIASLIRGATCNPVVLMSRLPRVMTSMALMLDAAGVGPSGPVGLLRTKGLALVYVTTLRAWLRDDTEDLAPTMAVLDKGLGRAEMLALQFCHKPTSTEQDSAE